MAKRRKKKSKKPPKQKKKLTEEQRRVKRERKGKYMTILINGQQKRVKRPPTIDDLPVEEFIANNADPIWLHQAGMWNPTSGEPRLIIPSAADSDDERGCHIPATFLPPFPHDRTGYNVARTRHKLTLTTRDHRKKAVRREANVAITAPRDERRRGRVRTRTSGHPE